MSQRLITAGRSGSTLRQPHEVAVPSVRQDEHPARRPPDLGDSAGIRQKPNQGCVPLENVRFCPASEQLVDDRTPAVWTPILLGPMVAWSRPRAELAGEEIKLAEADVTPAAGVPAKTNSPAIRVKSDALMDSLRVRCQRSESAIRPNHAQLPDLVPAPVVSNDEAQIPPGMRHCSAS